MPDHTGHPAAGFFPKNGCHLQLSLLFLEVDEFDLYQFMSLKGVSGRFDKGIGQTFLTDKYNGFECVGQAS